MVRRRHLSPDEQHVDSEDARAIGKVAYSLPNLGMGIAFITIEPKSPINFFDSICVAQPGWVRGITEFRCEAKGFDI
jgi:hypothetical protein